MAITLKDEEGNIIEFTFVRPDDWHLHVREGEMLCGVLPYTARVFGRAIIMPNLALPVTTTECAIEYRNEILRVLPAGSKFDPLMTLYFTDKTSPAEVVRAKGSGVVRGFKLYPAGATTNSHGGVTDIKLVYPALAFMENVGMPLLVHGEITSGDIFDRERMFLLCVLQNIIKEFPGLKVVLEHVTTREGVDFVKEAGPNVAATITAHHLHITRNDILVGGIKPHNYCLPIAKREVHRQALVAAATSGNPKFFLGTDSAPHPRNKKETACGCAGCFTAPSAIELYLRAFEQAKALENFEKFASFNGPDFYGLPRNTDRVTYESASTPWYLPGGVLIGDTEMVVPFSLKEGLHWRLVK